MTTLTELRANLYRLIDSVIETGKPIEIERKGNKILILLDSQKPSKLEHIKKRSGVIKHDDLINTTYEWHCRDLS